MSKSIRDFIAGEQGVTAIEYGVLAAAMAAAISLIFGADGTFVTALKNRFNGIADQIGGKGATTATTTAK